MMDFISCYSQNSLQVAQSSSCSSYTPSSCTIPPNSTPATQSSVSSLYKTTLSTGDRHLITVTWHRSATAQGLVIDINSGHDSSNSNNSSDGSNSTTLFRLSTHSSGLFRKKKGSKLIEIDGSKFEIYYDLTSAQYASAAAGGGGGGGGGGAEPVEGYYVVIMVDSEVGLVIGDMTEELTVKKLKAHNPIGKFSLICRKEYFSGNALYSTKAKFADTGNWHDILIRCTGANEGLRYPVLVVCVDKRVVIRVKRLHWNFRGNQTIFLDGLLVDLMWDVHDWFFNSDSGSGSGSGTGSSSSGSGSGQAVFMFRKRSGLDSRLWLEEKRVKNDEDQKNGFSLLIYASKS